MTEQPLRETVTLGPIPIFFCNQNQEMGLKSHCHTAAVSVVYEHPSGGRGFPSFKATNDALRARVFEMTGTEHPFRNATNEEATRRLFAHLDGYVAAEWEKWGGDYLLRAVHLDVEGVEDSIGHDAGVTRYTVERTT
jgi:hypothetical protein